MSCSPVPGALLVPVCSSLHASSGKSPALLTTHPGLHTRQAVCVRPSAGIRVLGNVKNRQIERILWKQHYLTTGEKSILVSFGHKEQLVMPGFPGSPHQDTSERLPSRPPCASWQLAGCPLNGQALPRLCHALDSLLVDKQGSEHFEDVSSEESPGDSLGRGTGCSCTRCSHTALLAGVSATSSSTDNRGRLPGVSSC